MSKTQKQLAQELLEILSTQPADDIKQLNRLATEAEQSGCQETAEHARELAKMFAEEDAARFIDDGGNDEVL